MLNPFTGLGQATSARATTHPPVYHTTAFGKARLALSKPAVSPLGRPGPRRVLYQMLGVFLKREPIATPAACS